MFSKLIYIIGIVVISATAPLEGYKVGDIVEPFTLKSVSGEMVSLSDYSGEKGVILIFDCNTCPYSQAYRDRIKDLNEMYADKGFPVVAVNPNDPAQKPGDSFDAMVDYARKHQYKHPYLQDTKQTVARAFGATNTPHVFVLENEDGDFRVAYIGAIDNNTRDASAADKHYVQDAVDALIQGKLPAENKTKAIGCSIKWKST